MLAVNNCHTAVTGLPRWTPFLVRESSRHERLSRDGVTDRDTDLYTDRKGDQLFEKIIEHGDHFGIFAIISTYFQTKADRLEKKKLLNVTRKPF